MAPVNEPPERERETPRRRKAGWTAALLVVAGGMAVAPTPAPSAEEASAAPAKEPAQVRLSEAVKVEVVAPDGVVDDLRGGQVLVLIRNVSGDPATLTGLEGRADESHGTIDLTPMEARGCTATSTAKPVAEVEDEEQALRLPCTLEADHQAVIPVRVTVHALKRTGKSPISIDVALTHGGRPGNVIATQAVSLGVFGESEALPLLQIPSILVLPGALFLTILLVLWRLGLRPLQSAKDGFPLAASGLEFWFVAALVSAGGLLVWLNFFDRNLLEGYGYRDISGVLAAATGSALLLSAAFGIVRRRQTKAKAASDALHVAAGDAPEKALGKLAKKAAGVAPKLPLVQYGKHGERLLFEGAAGGEKAVLGRPLRYALTTDDATAEAKLTELRAGSSVAAIAACLDELVRGGTATVGWKSGERPVEVKEDGFTQLGTFAHAIEPDPGD